MLNTKILFVAVIFATLYIKANTTFDFIVSGGALIILGLVVLFKKS